MSNTNIYCELKQKIMATDGIDGNEIATSAVDDGGFTVIGEITYSADRGATGGELTHKSMCGGSGEPEEGGSVYAGEGKELRFEKSPDDERALKAVALYDFKGENENDLSFKKGDVFTIISTEDGWWLAEINGTKGYIPSNYVKLKDTPGGIQTADLIDLRAHKGCRPALTIKLPHMGYSVWLSKDENIIFIGGNRCKKLTIIRDDGDRMTSLDLPIDSDVPVHAVVNGLSLSDNEHLISVYHKLQSDSEFEYKLFKLVLNKELSKVIQAKEIKGDSTKIFDYDDINIGVYCMKRVSSAEGKYRSVQVRDRDTLEIKKIVNFEDHVQKCTTIFVCRMPSGEFLVVDSHHSMVHKYHKDGLFIESYGTKLNTPGLVTPGKLWKPRKVCPIPDGFIVPCADGVIHRFQRGTWDAYIVLGKNVQDIQFTKDRIYNVLQSELIIYTMKA